MDNVDYADRFNAAMAKAFAASSIQARLAYFDLADFYHRKLSDSACMHPSAEMLRRAAQDACGKPRCWCRSR